MPFSILADVKTCLNQLQRATPHKRVSFRRFVRKSKLSQQAGKFVPSLGDAMPAQNGKDEESWGWASLLTPSTWMTMNCLQLIFAVKRYLEMHRSDAS